MYFSIITITRNTRDGLARTAASIAVQNFRDFEWIIIDGNSIDGTKEDFCRYEAMIISEPDDGIYDAMNKGLAAAKGRYVLFLNAGDILYANHILAEIHQNARLSNPDFIYGDAWEISADERFYKPANSHHNIMLGMFTHHQAMLYRREKIGDLRYALDYKIAADYDFTLEFLLSTEGCLHLPFAICDFEAGGISQQKALLGRKEQFLIRYRRKACSLWLNILVFLKQSLIWQLRNASPELYWKLRSYGDIRR